MRRAFPEPGFHPLSMLRRTAAARPFFPSVLVPMALLQAALLATSCASGSKVDGLDLSVELFDGASLAGWHADIPAADDDPTQGPAFVVRDGLLVSLGKPNGHLITNEAFSDYRLEVEYRWPGETGNCGVLVHASTPRRLYKMFPASIEVQMHHGNAGDFWCIGEDISVDDMETRRDPDPSTWGGDEGDKRRILNLTDDSENPPGEWNTMVIECVGDTIHVWVNGDKVNHGYDCTASSGQIAVQAEGAEVEFKRLDLTSLR